MAGAVNSRDAHDERLLELARKAGVLCCPSASIHLQTNPEQCSQVSERSGCLWQSGRKLHKYGIMVIGLFMFGLKATTVGVRRTLKFNIAAKFDMCGYSLLTPSPARSTGLRCCKRKQIVSFDWDKYDQSHIVFNRPDFRLSSYIEGIWTPMTDFIRVSMLRRFPWDGSRNPANWALYNAFFRKGGIVTRDRQQLIGMPTPEPEFDAIPHCFRKMRHGENW